MQLFYQGKTRYIGVFDNKRDSITAYELASACVASFKDDNPNPEQVEKNVMMMKKAAFSFKDASQTLESSNKKQKTAVKSSAPPAPPPKLNEKSSKSPPPTKGLKTPSSNYKGVSYSKQDKKYLALIEYGGKLHSLGYYKLESDAALAFDKGSIVLLSDADSPNFSTRQAYEKAIQREVEETDPSLDVKESYKDVVNKVEVYLSNIYAGEKKTHDMEIEHDSDVDSSDEEVSEAGKQNEPLDKKKKGKGTSDFIGVHYNTQKKKWRSSITHGGKVKQLGEYKLETDAALVYDEIVKVIRGVTSDKNFATLEDYEKAKKLELAKIGVSSDLAMSSAARMANSNFLNFLKAKVAEVVRKTWPTTSIQSVDAEEENVKKGKSSIYTGVSYRKDRKKWTSKIRHGGKQPLFGNYSLETDAALACDEGVKLLRGPNADSNFANLEEYEKAKKLELAKTDLGSDASMSYTAIKAKVTEVVRKTWPAASIHDDGSSKKEFVNTEMQEEDSASKKKTSIYVGVSFYKRTKKWRSQIRHGKKMEQLGQYTLEADAALAFDEAVKQLKGPEAGTNFSSLEDYKKAKTQELKETGLGSDAAMSSVTIKSKVTEVVQMNWPAASIDGGSNKRGSVHAEEYQNTSTTKKNKKSSDYVGVSFFKNLWKARATHNRSTFSLGDYKLQADAALAFDEAVKQLKGPTAKTNFTSFEAYEKAKKEELKETGLSGDAAAKSSASIISKISDILSKHRPNTTTKPSGNKTFPAHQQSKHSNYVGVAYNNSTQSFESEIKHGRRKHHIGHWNLQSDAALASDEARKLLNGEDCSNVNFASDQSYLDARSNEISKLFGSSVTIEPISSITTEIKRQLSKIPSPELDALNDAMATKWSRYLPSVTGNDFMALYQQSMGKLLGMTTIQQSEQQDTSTSLNAVTECAKDTEVPEGVLKPISDSGQKDTKSSQQEDESGDEASLFSGNDTEEEETDSVVNTSDKVEAGSQSVLNDNTASSTTKHKKSDVIKEFPIGCSVMWNMNDNSFNCGIVSSKPTKGMQYVVMDGEKSNSKLVPGESLLFGIDCPVYVAPSCKDKTPLLKGKVLMYTRKAYTILINKEGNQLQVMTGVTQDRVTFRRVEKVDSSAPPNKIAAASELNDTQKEKAPSQQPQPEKPRWQAPPSHKKAVEDNDNSTITSLDSAQASSWRQLANGSIPRKQGDNVENVDCRIYFPHWLIPDTASRQRLFCEYPTSVVYHSI